MDNIKKRFKDASLLDLALTHRSYLNENTTAKSSNERLEFLGDAVLEFVVSDALFNNFKDKEEGFLTALRANLVNTVNLARVASSLSLGNYLKLSKGEEDGGGRNNQSLLANTVESIIGALFIDNGINSAKSFIDDFLLVDMDKIASEPLKDPKSRLQELVQSRGELAPRYEVLEEKGPDHSKVFTIEVLVGGKSLAKGKGKNKAEAAQEAAKKALSTF